ncbi:MAG: pitrilysin family protein [bacterium]
MKVTMTHKQILGIIAGLAVMAAVMVPLYFFYQGAKMPVTRSRPNFHVSTEGIKKVTLNNGMTILVYPNHSVPKVLLQIAYNVGGYVEQAGERGLAHLIEHMIFKGTEKLSETDIKVIAQKYGSSCNAFTSRDVTSYYFETDKNNWKPFMQILADCMQNARFDEQHLASELKTVIQELKMYKDDYWDLMFNKIDTLLYPSNHPYHAPLIGYKEDLMNLSAQNLKHFYKKYYQPNKAILIIIGDVDAHQAIAEAKKYFENIPSQNHTSETFFPEEQKSFSTQHTCFYEDIKTEQLGFYWRIPGSKDNTEIISNAAAFLLGSGEGSRLYKTLVDEQKIASSVGVIAHHYFESGSFLILIEPIPGKSDACQEIIQKEITKAIKNGFTSKELEHMVKIQGKRFFQRLQRFGSFAYEWLISFFTTGDEQEVFKHANKFVDLDSTDIQEFLEHYIDPFLINRIEVLPIPKAKRATHEQAKKDEEALDQKILSKYQRTTTIEPPKFALNLADPTPLEFSFPKPDRKILLNNGLTILLKSNKHLPLISLNCKHKNFFHLANAQDGLAVDLMMSMLIESSVGFNKQDNVGFFEFNGVDYEFNAQGAQLSLLSDTYEEIFERFLHVLTKPNFKAEAIEKLKTIFIDTLTRSSDDPVTVGLRELKTIIYKNHPFGWNFQEAINSIKKITLNDIKQLHNNYISPENMILCVVGDFDLDHMGQTLRTLFSTWQQGTEKKITYPAITCSASTEKDVSMLRDQLVLLLGQPSPINIHHPDLVPIKLLNSICFNDLGSRIYQLREQSGSFYVAIGSWAANAGTETGFDFVGAILNTETAPQVEKLLKELIDNVGQAGVTKSELYAAQQQYLKTLIDAIAQNSSVANVFGTLEAFGLEFDYYDKVLKRIQTIELSELNKIAQKYFSSKNLSRVRVGRV